MRGKNMKKEVDIKSLKKESKELDLKIKEMYKQYIQPLESQKNKIDNTIKNTIQSPKCKKYFKYVYLEKVVNHCNYGRGGYFGDEVRE